MFTSIVVALDLERAGDRSLPIAGSLSALTDVSVELLTVQSPGMSDVGRPGRVASPRHRQRLAGGLVHGPPGQRSGQGDRRSRQRSTRRPADHVDDCKVAVEAQFLGSVSEGVLSRVGGPVLLVGPRVPADTDLSRPTLVACVDSTDAAKRALPVITAWVHTFKSASPWVVEVLPAPLERVRRGPRDGGVGLR